MAVPWKKHLENKPNPAIPELSEENLKIFVAFIFAALLIVSGLMIYNKLQQQPEKFTEFYLKNSEAKISAGREAKVSFVVANHEGKKTSYEYRVSYSGNSNSKIISLENEEEKEFSENLEFTNSGQEKISLHLINLDSNKVLELWQWLEVQPSKLSRVLTEP